MKRISTELLLRTLNLYAPNVLTKSALTNGEEIKFTATPGQICNIESFATQQNIVIKKTNS